MNRTKIIIHLGAHKTATTTIQDHLDANYNCLLEQGILALTTSRLGKDDDEIRSIFCRKLRKNKIGIFISRLFPHSPGKIINKYFLLRARKTRFWDLVKEKYGSSCPRKIILSEENLLAEVFKKDTFDLYPNTSRLVLLKTILGSSPDEIHFTIRNYDTFLASAYATTVVHTKKPQPPFECIRKAWCASAPRGWVDVVTDIKKIFPESILRLSVYECDSVEKRLKFIIGPDVSLTTLQHSKQLNVRATVEAINARHVQTRNHYLRVTPTFDLLAKHANGKKFDPLTKQEKTLLASRYNEDVASLKKHDNICFYE